MEKETDLKTKLPECSICADMLDDPRQLPCGHCYCGPHKQCLHMLKQADGIKCALCGTINAVSIDSLRPMYGLREFLEQQREVSAHNCASENKELGGQCLYCSEHPKNKSKYWCKNCEILLCSLCLEEPKHLEHRFILFQANIKSILSDRLSRLTAEKTSRMQQLQQKIAKLKLISKTVRFSLNQLLEARKELEHELEVLKLNWAQLESIASGAEPNTDFTLIRWLFNAQFLIPIAAEAQTEENSLNSIIAERFEQGTQTTESNMVLKIDKETETDHKQQSDKSSQVELAQPGSSKTAAKAENSAHVDSGIDEAVPHRDPNYFGINQSQTFGDLASNSPPIIRDQLFFSPMYVYLPLDSSLQTNIIIWSQVSTPICTFRLGIERWRNNYLRVHVEIRQSIRPLAITIHIKKLEDGGAICLWRDLMIGGTKKHLWRQTDFSWTQMSDSLPGILQFLVDFRMVYSSSRPR